MSYQEFALYYDRLTENVDYQGYADYIDRIFKSSGTEIKSVLDVACGTGSLTLALADLGYEMIGTDASADMLSVARSKCTEGTDPVLFLNQSMDALDLYGTVDAAVCTLDSINHVLEEENVKKAFQKISLFMNKGGIFVFDVNTLYKHREILGDNTFVYDLDDLYCVWQNYLDPECADVDIELDFFVGEHGNYKRSSEAFTERIYTHETLCGFLKEAGFRLEGYYNEMSFEQPDGCSERVVYVARKQEWVN